MGGKPPPHTPDHYKIIFCLPPPAKVLVAPLEIRI